MSNTETTTVTANVPSDLTARPIPVIKPENVSVNMAGHRWREVEVRLPQGATFGDLNEPRMFRMVQANTLKALRQWDRLTIIAFDESWIAHCIVTEATGTGVTLTKPQKVEMRSGAHKLLQTADHLMRWTGGGYEILRRSDEVVVVPECATAEQAERELWLRMPKKVQ